MNDLRRRHPPLPVPRDITGWTAATLNRVVYHPRRGHARENTLPATDGSGRCLAKGMRSEAEQRLLPERLNLQLSQRRPPRIRAGQIELATVNSVRACVQTLGPETALPTPPTWFLLYEREG